MLRYGGGKLLIASLVLFVFGGAVLYANRPERASGVSEELIGAAEVLPENEGKLVIVSGTPEFVDGGVIIDEEAGLKVENAVYYDRIPYQKVYVKKTREVIISEGKDKLSKEDDEKRIESYVAEEWIYAGQEREESLLDNGTRCENPPAVNLSAYHASGEMSLSGFRITPADLSEYIHRQDCWFTEEELREACGDYIRNSGINLQAATTSSGHGMLSSGSGIGDVQVVISYETLEEAEPVTMIGRQVGDTLVLEEDGPVSEAEQVQPGLISREEFLKSITSEDASSRKIGIGALVLGAILFLASLDWGGWFRPKKAEPEKRKRKLPD